MRNVKLALATTVVAIVMAGCGDDDNSSSEAASSSIAKDEFLAQGNEICAAGDAEIEAAAQDTFASGQPSKSEMEAFATETVIPSVEAQVAGLHDLGVPAGEEAEIGEILEAADQALAKAKADPLSLTAEVDPFVEVNQLATDYGLTDCGAA